MKTSFVHVSDLGLKNLPYGGINPETGLNKRFEDVLRNFKFVVSEAIKNKVEFFVVAGDINEERNPESILIEKFSGFVADLVSQNIKVIVVAGNHDLDGSKGTSTSISYIKSLGLVNTYISDLKPETFEFDNVVYHCLPYMIPSQVGCKDNKELTTYINEYVNRIKINPNKKNVLVSHYSLETTFYGLDVDEPYLINDNLSKFDYVALGHIHKYEMFKSFVGGYTGSLFCKDFGEQPDKYFNIVTLEEDAKISRISVPERTFKQYTIDGIDLTSEELLEQVKSEVTDCKDAIIKLKIKARKRINPKLIYEYLRTLEVFHYIPIEWKTERESEAQKLEVAEGMRDVDVVFSYLDKQEMDNKQDVQNYISGKIQKWEELYVY